MSGCDQQFPPQVSHLLKNSVQYTGSVHVLYMYMYMYMYVCTTGGEGGREGGREEREGERANLWTVPQ